MVSASDKHESPAGDASPAEASTTPEQVESPASAQEALIYDPLAPDPAADGVPPSANTPVTPGAAEESTVGTGTSIALGCIAGSVVLIIIAILILFAVSVFAQ